MYIKYNSRIQQTNVNPISFEFRQTISKMIQHYTSQAQETVLENERQQAETRDKCLGDIFGIKQNSNHLGIQNYADLLQKTETLSIETKEHTLLEQNLSETKHEIIDSSSFNNRI